MLENLRVHKKLLNITAFLFPVLLYLNTIANEYALDDSIVITENGFIKEGLSGLKNIFHNDSFSGVIKKKVSLIQGGRYRPLSIASFNIEYSIWKNNPHISHLINALLYGLLCLILFLTLENILKLLDTEGIELPVAFISTMIFAFHPLHTEVVANIKGRDEIMSMLFGLLSLNMFLTSLDKKKLWISLISGIFLFLALLSKENSIMMLAVAGLLILMNFKKDMLRFYAISILFMSTGVLLYFLMRSNAVGIYSGDVSDPLMNNSYFYATVSQKITTIIYVLLLYLKLLVIPHPLTYDYYPYHIQYQSWQNPLIEFSLLLYIFLIIAAFYYFRRKKIISFSILLYFIMIIPVSNIFINIGIFMNERFAFYASIGFSLISGYLIVQLFRHFQTSTRIRNIIISGFVFVIVVFGILTMIRSRQWKNNYTLFLHDVKISSGSAKGNFMAGAYIFVGVKNNPDSENKRKSLDQSISYLTKATDIYPHYSQALLFLGDAIFARDKDFHKALPYYTKVFSLTPDYEFAYTNFKRLLTSLKDPFNKKDGYFIILKAYPQDFEANYQLGLLYGKNFQKLDSALIFLKKAVNIKPDSKSASRDLAVALAFSGKPEQALVYFEKVLQMEPNEPSNYLNIGYTYQQLGNTTKAAEYFKKAEILKAKGRGN